MNSYDVIVIGVGGMGSSACYHLSKRGYRVLGLEQFNLGHHFGSSHGETRMIRRAYFEHSNYIPLLNRAYELWKDLETESKQSIFIPCGLVIYADPKTSAVYQGTLKSAQKYKIELKKWDRPTAIKKFPIYLPAENQRALFEPEAGLLHVERAVLTHTSVAKQFGAQILENVKVLDYEILNSCVKVRTNQGVFEAAKLVVTSGPWSGALLKELGLPLKLHRLYQHWFKASPKHRLENAVPCFAFHSDEDFYYGFPMLDGKTIKIASHFSRETLLNPSEKDALVIPEEKIDAVRNFIKKSLPLVTTDLDRISSCIYTMTPDEHFIIDTHPEINSLVFAAGFSGHGFKFSSVTGEILADLTLEGKTKYPIDFLSLKRF